jgi:hypothetical protein
VNKGYGTMMNKRCYLTSIVLATGKIINGGRWWGGVVHVERWSGKRKQWVWEEEIITCEAIKNVPFNLNHQIVSNGRYLFSYSHIRMLFS